jgi:hypothetical protein
VLAELAEVELAWHLAYRAAETPPFDATALAAMPSEDIANLQFTLPASAHLLKSPNAAGRLWQAWQEGSGFPETKPDGRDHLLVIRPDADVEVRFLDSAGFVFLDELDAGQTLVEAFEAANKVDPEFDLQRALQDFIAGGTFTSFHISGPTD